MTATDQKAESLADKMNKLTEKFNLAEELIVEGKDIVEYVEEHTTNVELLELDFNPAEIVNLKTLVDDFCYVRETLRETTDNGRRILNTITLDLLDSEEESKASLVESFASLNKSIGDNMKIYIQSYREISNIILNLHKTKGKSSPNVVNNTVNVNTVEPVSTVELLNQLRSKKS